MSHVVQFPKLGITFTVNEIAFSIGSFQVRWYGLLIAIGFLLAIFYASRSVQKMNIDMNRLIDAVLVGLIGAIVCARLYYVVFYTDSQIYWNDPIKIVWDDGIGLRGLAIYGGVIGAFVFGGITAKIRKLKVPAVLDLASLGFLIGQCIGRWGNLVNQEAFGSATSLPWGMYSENTEYVVPGSPVHPCFLYESLLCLLGFILLHIFNRRSRRYDGQTFLLYIVWYGVCRFFIEGLRTDSLYIPHTGLRVSQVLAAVCVVIGCILLFVFRHKTSLTGCGSAQVMEGIGITSGSQEDDDDPASEFSTIFGDLPPEELGLDLDLDLDPEPEEKPEEDPETETPQPEENEAEEKDPETTEND